MKKIVIAGLFFIALDAHSLVVSVGFDGAGLGMALELVDPSSNAVNVASGGFGLGFMGELGDSYCLIVTLGANACPMFISIGGEHVDPSYYTMFALADCSVAFGRIFHRSEILRVCAGLGLDGAMVVTPWGEWGGNAFDVYGISIGIGATAEVLLEIADRFFLSALARAYPSAFLYFLEDEYAGIQPCFRWGFTIGCAFDVL